MLFELLSSPPTALHKVLLIDNELANVQMVENYLADQPYQVNIANSSQAALEYLQKEKPDLILTNVNLDACYMLGINNMLEDLSIIFLTNKDQLNNHSRNVHIDNSASYKSEYLIKPFSKDELIARINTQIVLLAAKNRIAASTLFANRIAQFDNIEQLIEQAFRFLANDKYLGDVAVFNKDKLKFYEGNDRESIELTYQYELKSNRKNKQIQKIICESGSCYLLVQLPSIKDWKIVVQLLMPFTDIEKEYIQNIVHQILLVHNNINKSMRDPQLLANLNKIFSKLEEIDFIRGANQYVELNLSNNKTELLLISLKNIKSSLVNNLIQVHRSYLINPNKVKQVRKKSKSRYELLMGQHYIPVGDSYFKKLRDSYPYWFQMN